MKCGMNFGALRKARATMNSEIIVVKQLPVIVEQLQTIKADVTERVNAAMSLVCNEETVKTVKEARAELNKEFKGWEEKRRQVKTAVMSPYEEFEAAYKDCITDVFKKADADLKGKIDSVESDLKERKFDEVFSYFNEYLDSKGIDFVHFSQARINITLSASMKSLKEQAKAFIDRVCDDLSLIDTQEHKEEILYEYKQSLNVSNAITTVSNRYKAIEEAKARASERAAKIEAEKEGAAKVEAVVETLAPPTVEEPILTVKFAVKGTRAQLRALKEFLKNGGYDYE